MTSSFNNLKEELKRKIRELFQFETADLDHGIYRIMNYKRKEIEKFIEEDIIGRVRKELVLLGGAEREKIESQLRELSSKSEVKEYIEALQHDDKDRAKIYKEDFSEVIKEYETLKAQFDEIKVSEDVERRIYNYLINFFSRYYENGDFITKRRYGKSEKYIIPYNGEEVLLFWTNKDQYYIKTSEYFKNYSFKVKGDRGGQGGQYILINFKIVITQEEKGNIKEQEKKYFVLNDKIFDFNKQEKILNIYFEYRTLTEKEKKIYGNSRNVQGKINESIIKELKGKILKDTTIATSQETLKGISQETLKGISQETLKDTLKLIFEENSNSSNGNNSSDGVGKSLIEKHLYRYTKRNMTDYFIHRDLKGFLERELDFYIKNEFLRLDDLAVLEQSGYYDKLKVYLIGAMVLRNIALRIIDFLAQIENFQKRLWEKKKFVINTNYVITLDKIKEYAGDSFLEGILDDILNNEKQLKEWEELFKISVNEKSELIANAENLLKGKDWEKLPIDTKYFDEGFKWKLLMALSKKNDLDKIIDGILVKSENWQALNLLMEKYRGKISLIYIDPPYNTRNDEFLYKDNYQHSSWLTMIENRLVLAERMLQEDGYFYCSIDWNESHHLRKLLDMIFGPNRFQREIIWNTGENISGFKSLAPNWIRQHDTIFFYTKSGNTKILNKLWSPIDKSEFSWTPMTKLDIIGPEKDSLYIEKWEDGKLNKVKINTKNVKAIGDIWNDIYSFQYSFAAANEGLAFQTQKPEDLLRRIIQASTNKGDLVLDFFAGSGTTPATAHKLGRKYISIEISEYFYDIIIPRMKKVLFGDASGISKKINWKGGGFFKYHTLEQYEDALENIEFEPLQPQKVLYDFADYFVKYMLDWETKKSQTFLNIKDLEDPFNYKLKIIQDYQLNDANLDLVETFNYLLGLNLKWYKILWDNDRKYVFVFGKKDNKEILIVWRSIIGIDFKKDREIVENITRDLNFDEIYINGDALVKDFKSIGPIFKILLASL
ncbi:MAG: site-specific DNA-methyltransferase [Promethearchaeota archaeon]